MSDGIDQKGFDLGSFIGGISDVLNIGNTVGNLFARKKTWEREDSAIQRRVKDLEAAGLNKVLAVGSAATSAPIQVDGSRVGAAVDARLKNQQVELGKQQLINAKQANYLNEPDVIMAQMKINGLADLRGPGRPFDRLWRDNLVSDQVNQQAIYRKAQELGVPAEFLLSGPGQALMLNQVFNGMSAKEQARFLTFLALQGIAGSAGNVVPNVGVGRSTSVGTSTIIKGK